MTDYVQVCESATTGPVPLVDFATDCSTAGGSVVFVPESAWGLPDLSLDDAALIASSVLLLWAAAWAFRVLSRQLRED